jgi:hypothetical protein
MRTIHVTLSRIWSIGRVVCQCMLAAALAALSPSSAYGQTGFCMANADTAASHIAATRLSLSGAGAADSLRLKALGLPYNPASVTLVTTDSKCKSVVNAYNAQWPAGDPHRVQRGYVIKVGTSAFALILANQGLDKPRNIFFFNASFKWLVAIAVT